jgi:HlyD family secretion protein
VRAPLEGTVESTAAHPNDELRPIEQGDPVIVGQTLFTIATRDDFVVRAKIDEQDIFEIKPGQRVKVSGEDLGNRVLDGSIVTLAPIVRRSDDPASTARHALATIRLKQRVPFLRDGMAVDVDVITRDERHVLTVPRSAIRRNAQGSHVLIVRKNDVDLVTVTLGARNDTEVVVRSGLRDGDTIVADPPALPSP